MSNNIAYRLEDVVISPADVHSAHVAMDGALSEWSAAWKCSDSFDGDLERNGFLTAPTPDGGVRLAAYVWPRPHLEDVVLESIAPYLSPEARIIRLSPEQTIAYAVREGRMIRQQGVTWSEHQGRSLCAG